MRYIVPPVLAICGLLIVAEARADDTTPDLVGSWTGGGPGVQTELVAVNLYRRAFTEWDPGLSRAMAYIILIIIIAISNLYIKYLNQMRGEG